VCQLQEKVMARSLPFKGLRKRTLDPDEITVAAATKAAKADPEKSPEPPVPLIRGRNFLRDPW